METKHIHIKDYNYALPDERIAKFPLAQRDRSKLLLYKHSEVSEDVFCNIADHLPKGALMVFNNTRVIQARMHFRKATGALIEVFLLEPYAPADYEQMFQTKGECEWLCMIGNLKKWKGETLERTFDVNGEAVTLKAERLEDVGKSYSVPGGTMLRTAITSRCEPLRILSITGPSDDLDMPVVRSVRHTITSPQSYSLMVCSMPPAMFVLMRLSVAMRTLAAAAIL